MMEGEGLGLVLAILAIWRFFVVGLLACLVGVESGSKVVFLLDCFAFAFAFALLCCWCCWESLWFKREKGGEC